ncbi:MAG: hypothetical protein ACT4PI_15745 [Actinomycetota bacterium]
MVLVVIVAGLLAWYAWGRIFSIPHGPLVLRRAQQGDGTLDVVVVVDDGNSEPSEGALPALLRPGADVGRRLIARVLPEGTHRHDAQVASRQLGRYADSVGAPAAGAAVFFGTSDAAVRRFALGDDYDVLLHLRSETIPKIDCDGAASQRLSTPK